MRRAASIIGPYVIALLLLLALEGAARVRDRILYGDWPQTPEVERYEAAARLRAVVMPDSALIAVLRPGGKVSWRGKSASINSLGYRGAEFAHPKQPGVFRILAIGGSTTFDVRVSDDDAAWPACLQRRLAKRFLQRAIEVVNGGLPGYTTDEMLRKLESRDLVAVEPDLVLAYVGLNDLQPSAAPGFKADYSVGHPELQRRALGFESKAPNWLQRSVLLYKLGKHLPLGRAPSTPRLDAPLSEAAQAYEQRIERIARLAHDHGATCVFLTQGLRFDRDTRPAAQDSLDAYRWLPYLTIHGIVHGLEQYNDITREAGARAGAQVIDVARELHPGSGDFADYCHWTDAGADKMAAFVASSLPDSLFVAAGARSAASGPAQSFVTSPVATVPPPTTR